MLSDEIMALLLEEQEVPLELIHKTIREGTIVQQICPVMIGTAYRNKGVQPLLDAVNRYLPSPLDREIFAKDHSNGGAEVPLAPDPDAPLVAMAFKLVEEPFGQVTFVRIYQGTLQKGTFYYNTRQKKRARISRILRVHADQKEDIDSASAGDIVAVMGIECATGDTYCSEGSEMSLESIYAAEPVIDLSIQPAKRADYDKLAKALNRFMREDPTFRVHVDKETSETIISGMGELHLEIYVERIRREYKVECTVGAPKVSYREAPTVETPFNYKHKKQTGGSGQYAHIVGRLIPLDPQSPETFVFENKVTGGRIPTEYIPSVEKGFRDSMHKGPVAGYEVMGVQMRLEDGSYHDVDSSTMAFEICARDCFRETFKKAEPVLLEPIMKVEVEIPTEFQGPVTGTLSSKRGVILGTESRSGYTVIAAEVPLAEMFGYSNDLRSSTQGKGSFSMEFLKYQKLPSRFQEEIVKKADPRQGRRQGLRPSRVTVASLTRPGPPTIEGPGLRRWLRLTAHGPARPRRSLLRHELSRLADHPVPLERRARVDLVRLHVEVPEHAVVIVVLGGRQVAQEQFPLVVPRVVALDLGEDRAERGREPGQGLVLLRREVVLHQRPTVDVPRDLLGAGRPETGGDGGHGVAVLGRPRDDEPDATRGVGPIPLVERVGFLE